MIPTYSGKTPYTVSPDTQADITPTTGGWRAYMVSVSAQACYVTFDGSAPTSTNGLTLPAGFVGLIPTKHVLTCKSATAGSIVNAIALY